MAKLITLEEAAQLLGISADKLTEMRSRNEIFGYRDGATWKFKLDELERVAGDMGITLGGEPAADQDQPEELADLSELTLEDESADAVEFEDGDQSESDSILVSEEELGKSDDTTASTIIGEEDLLAGGDSDVRPDEAAEQGSELRLASDSNDEVEPPTSDLLAASDVLAEEGEKPASPSDTAQLKPLSGSADELSPESGSGSFDLSLEDEEESAAGSELELKSESKAGASGFGSAIDLDLDDELVLGSSGSDVTSGAGDSGINLNHPSDSGLSLEEPLDLATGSGVESLELGEDDLAELDKVGAEEGAGGQADDDFLLTPVDSGVEEDGESGSQVIDLDSGEFEESAADLLSPEEPAVLEEEEETVGFEEVEMEPPGQGLAVPAPTTAAVQGLEAQYTIWNVVSLFLVVLLLGFTGMLMIDLMNNIWSWDGNYEFNSAIMDAILGWFSG